MNTTHQLISRINTLSSPMKPLPTGLTYKVKAPLDINVILFDVYGTLFISGSGDIGILKKRQSGEALASAMQDAGFTGQLDQAGRKGSELFTECIQRVHRELKATGVEYPEVEIREIWQSVCRELLNDKTLDKVPTSAMIEHLAIEYECRVNPVWPMPHLKELLTTYQQQNTRIGIISNAQFFTPLLFDALTEKAVSDWGFDASLCIWSYDNREAKPSIHLFERALDKLDVAPENILYVGNDVRNDIYPAQQCGIRTALFAGDERSLRLRKDDPNLAAIQPDMILTDLKQLLLID